MVNLSFTKRKWRLSMIKEFSSKKEIKSVLGGSSSSTGTYTGTVIPADLDKEDRKEDRS
jgi:hypothetical protein